MVIDKNEGPDFLIRCFFRILLGRNPKALCGERTSVQTEKRFGSHADMSVTNQLHPGFPHQQLKSLTCSDTGLSATCLDPGFCQLSPINKSHGKNKQSAKLGVLRSSSRGQFVPQVVSRDLCNCLVFVSSCLFLFLLLR